MVADFCKEFWLGHTLIRIMLIRPNFFVLLSIDIVSDPSVLLKVALPTNATISSKTSQNSLFNLIVPQFGDIRDRYLFFRVRGNFQRSRVEGQIGGDAALAFQVIEGHFFRVNR